MYIKNKGTGYRLTVVQSNKLAAMRKFNNRFPDDNWLVYYYAQIVEFENINKAIDAKRKLR